MKNNKAIAMIAYMFLAAFLAMIAYFIYFQLRCSEEFMNNPYNTLQNLAEEKVLRGEILTSDGVILARTHTEEADDTASVRVYPYEELFFNITEEVEESANFWLLRSHQFFVEKIANDFLEKKSRGDRVVTSVDFDLQELLCRQMQGLTGCAILVEPVEGRILGLYADQRGRERKHYPMPKTYQTYSAYGVNDLIRDMYQEDEREGGTENGFAPLELAAAACAVAEGEAVRPSLLKRVENDKGVTVREFAPQYSGALSDTEDLNRLRILMRLEANDLRTEEDEENYILFGLCESCPMEEGGCCTCFTGYVSAEEHNTVLCLVLEGQETQDRQVVSIVKNILNSLDESCE